MKKRINPFKSIYQACNAGDLGLKMKNLPGFPRCIDIELTNECNFKCLMCPIGTSISKRKKGFMEDYIFNKIAEEVKLYKTPMRFIRWGEPLLHPKFIDYVKVIKSAGCLVHINTNGSLLNDGLIGELLDIPIDSIKFSFQGVDRKSYREMRNIDFYDGLLNIVKLFYKKRGDRQYPYIHISTTVTYESAGQIDKFKDEVKEFVDLVTVGRTTLEHIDIGKVRLSDGEVETLSYLKKQESLVKKHLRCIEVFDKLSINYDGTVSACCADWDQKMIVGDLRKEELKDIWNSKEMNFYRAMLAQMRHDELELCRTCYDNYGLQTPGLQNID